ncbi:MAG: M1 family metallopeptidase [Chitinophagales bacterium]
MHKYLFAVSLLMICAASYAQKEEICYVADAESVIREHNMDFHTMDLQVRFAPEDGAVFGHVTYTLSPLAVQADSVFLDGPGILIEKIQLNGSATRFHTDSAGITIYFDPPLIREQEYTLDIDYSAYPKKGIYFNGWHVANTDSETDPTVIRKQIWTQGQGTDNRFWIPCYDTPNDKLMTSTHITFDAQYTVVSNGKLINKTTNTDNTITWDYSMLHPMATYLIMIAIGKYDTLQFRSKNGITTTQYYYPGTHDYAMNTYSYTAEVMDFLETETGFAYPWETYANVPVQEFLYGAMENTTATIYSDYFYQDANTRTDKDYYPINAHELTHQWFGDYVTAWSNSHQWLQESFATYYAKLFRKYLEGDDVYAWMRRDEMLAAFDLEDKNNYPMAHAKAGSQRIYQKGSYVLDMMRYVLGDAAFRLVINDYLHAHPYGNVESHDLEMQCMRSLGVNMHWFFEEWVYHAGYPVYQVSYTIDDALAVHMHILQTQQGDAFDMPVHLQVHYENGMFSDTLVRIAMDTFDIVLKNTIGDKVAFVLFDPGTMVFSRVHFDKSYRELRYQAFNAPMLMDRYDAIEAMTNTAIESKRDDLIALYYKESFFGIRAEIISQLAAETDKKSIALLKAALLDSDPRVRRAVLANIQAIPKPLQKDLEAMLDDPNYVNAELALYRLTQLQPDKKDVYLQRTERKKGANNNIRITWLVLACQDHPEKYINELTSFSSAGYEFRTRIAAMSGLQNLNYCDAQVAANLLDAACSTNNRLASPARNALIQFRKEPKFKKIIDDYYAAHAWDDWQTNRLKPIFQ